ncbi:hypothetical protein DERF_006565 [Dermatophagoides farinae]|uniref:Uncharacterized protein n=1 Tax=Dermatophagoides farinae TaxID=6954 RepID=A0A922L7U4_DERFA|nr:hypothetical protein DERF_006565 [Dermatophagoides farinae]
MPNQKRYHFEPLNQSCVSLCHKSFVDVNWIDACPLSWPTVHKMWRRSLSLIALLFAAIKSLRNRLAREQSFIIWSTL